MTSGLELPDGWEVRPLEELAVPSVEKVDPTTVPDAVYLGLEHIEAHTRKIVGQGSGADVQSTKAVFHAGDVLYGKLRPYLNKVAVPAFDGIASTDILVFRPADDVVAEYLARALNSAQFVEQAHHSSKGMELPRTSWKALRHVAVPVPSREIQERIVKLLAEIDKRRDGALAGLDRAQQYVASYKASIVAAACSGALTVDWRSAHEGRAVPAPPALGAQGAKHASGSPNTSALTTIPAGWAWWPIETMTERVIDYRGRTPPSAAAGLIPHIRTTEIRDGKIDWEADRFVTPEVYEEYMTRGIPQRGDVLFTMEAPMGEVGVIDRDDAFSIAQRILLMRPAEDVDGDYLSLCLQSPSVSRAMYFRSTGSGVRGIAYKRLRSVELPKPPLEEQREITRRVRQILESVSSIEQRIARTRSSVERTSQATLGKALRGELTPTGVGE